MLSTHSEVLIIKDSYSNDWVTIVLFGHFTQSSPSAVGEELELKRSSSVESETFVRSYSKTHSFSLVIVPQTLNDFQEMWFSLIL